MRLKFLSYCLFALLCSSTLLISDDFTHYPSQSFEGKYTIPPTYQLQSNGWEYRDENNLSIGEIKANFAGKFCIILHPCGSGCRFYSLLDLESGREDYEILSDFNTTPDEREKPSIDVLISRKESNLLIVRSFFEDNSCKQSFYLLENKNDKNSLKLIAQEANCTKEQK